MNETTKKYGKLTKSSPRFYISLLFSKFISFASLWYLIYKTICFTLLLYISCLLFFQSICLALLCFYIFLYKSVSFTSLLYILFCKLVGFASLKIIGFASLFYWLSIVLLVVQINLHNFFHSIPQMGQNSSVGYSWHPHIEDTADIEVRIS